MYLFPLGSPSHPASHPDKWLYHELMKLWLWSDFLVAHTHCLSRCSVSTGALQPEWPRARSGWPLGCHSVDRGGHAAWMPLGTLAFSSQMRCLNPGHSLHILTWCLLSAHLFEEKIPDLSLTCLLFFIHSGHLTPLLQETLISILSRTSLLAPPWAPLPRAAPLLSEQIVWGSAFAPSPTPTSASGTPPGHRSCLSADCSPASSPSTASFLSSSSAFLSLILKPANLQKDLEFLPRTVPFLGLPILVDCLLVLQAQNPSYFFNSAFPFNFYSLCFTPNLLILLLLVFS